MYATPLDPGRRYRVHYAGRTLDVLAAHPCDAINAAIDHFLSEVQ